MAIEMTMEEGIQRAERTLDLWHRVCAECEEGKPWPEIDNGLQKPGMSKPAWTAYMRQRMYHDLHGLVLIYRHGPKSPTPPSKSLSQGE